MHTSQAREREREYAYISKHIAFKSRNACFPMRDIKKITHAFLSVPLRMKHVHFLFRFVLRLSSKRLNFFGFVVVELRPWEVYTNRTQCRQPLCPGDCRSCPGVWRSVCPICDVCPGVWEVAWGNRRLSYSSIGPFWACEVTEGRSLLSEYVRYMISATCPIYEVVSSPLSTIYSFLNELPFSSIFIKSPIPMRGA